MLNTLVLSTKNPMTLVMGGSKYSFVSTEKAETNISWFINSLYDYGITEVKFIFEFIKKELTNKI